MEKSILLSAVHDIREAWEAILAELGPQRLEIPGASGEWRVRDILAHMNGYDRWQLIQLRSAFSGETPTEAELTGGIQYPPSSDMHEDSMNAMFVAGTRDLATAEILRHWREVSDMRADWVSSSTQDQLDADIGGDWVSGSARIIRLASEVSSVSDPLPVWKFLHQQIEHQRDHLNLLRAWIVKT